MRASQLRQQPRLRVLLSKSRRIAGLFRVAKRAAGRFAATSGLRHQRAREAGQQFAQAVADELHAHCGEDQAHDAVEDVDAREAQAGLQLGGETEHREHDARADRDDQVQRDAVRPVRGVLRKQHDGGHRAGAGHQRDRQRDDADRLETVEFLRFAGRLLDAADRAVQHFDAHEQDQHAACGAEGGQRDGERGQQRLAQHRKQNHRDKNRHRADQRQPQRRFTLMRADRDKRRHRGERVKHRHQAHERSDDEQPFHKKTPPPPEVCSTTAACDAPHRRV